ncbi:MAG TPA: maleylpyruvate isomerase family mycothiol-dependent enzyme [Acidimicrobiia bacterium]|nr:maleylpyruvate isomerase family mycothiol-dependent enzyme [Acidimicrobiia bacterium]
MALDRIAAVRGERDAVVALCRTLSPEEWARPSQCDGWSVQDVVAHLSAIAHGVFTPWMVKFMTAKSVERNNDADVERRRSWAPEQVLAEYEKWSSRMVKLLALGQRPPLAKAPFKIGELGVYPMALVASASVFDTHVHLHYDLAPAVGRTLPPPPPGTVAVINEWVLGGIPKMCRQQLAFMDRPVTITLDGDGGGSWALVPGGGGKPGRIEPAPMAESAATITGNAREFAVWATRRRPWREQDVKIDGDEDYATRVLDGLHVV